MPFSKPRFVLENDGLRLVNSPTIPPEELPSLVADFDNSSLAEYEYFYNPEDYVNHWWLESRLVGFGLAMMESGERDRDLDPELTRLAIAIAQDFEEDVESHDAQFYIVHLPDVFDLHVVASGDSFWYADLLQHFDTNHRLVRTEAELSSVGLESCFVPDGHYAAPCNEGVARALADQIAQHLEPQPSS
jgi:hypothetical protein